jgi:uncharacterized membrane protein YdjX (TVP38/TMEM64 family)
MLENGLVRRALQEATGPFGISFDAQSPSTLIIYVALTILVNSFVPAPLAGVMCALGVLLYGWLGFLLNLVAAVVGCYLGFIAIRLCRPFFAKLLGSERAAAWYAIDGALVRDGYKIPLLLRMTPVMPVVLANSMLALTSVDSLTYTWTTFVGFIPSGLPYAYAAVVGEQILEEFPPKDPLMIATSLVGLLATVLAVWKIGSIAHSELTKAGAFRSEDSSGEAEMRLV